jgi:hypothetical protein
MSDNYRKESTSDIVVNLANEEVVVERLTLDKNIDMEETGGSGRPLPDGVAIHSVRYQGTMECVGNRRDLDEKFYDDNGLPKQLPAISITHLDGSLSGVQDVFVASDGYEASFGETTSTTYSFIAMRKFNGSRVDSQPSN